MFYTSHTPRLKKLFHVKQKRVLNTLIQNVKVQYVKLWKWCKIRLFFSKYLLVIIGRHKEKIYICSYQGVGPAEHKGTSLGQHCALVSFYICKLLHVTSVKLCNRVYVLIFISISCLWHFHIMNVTFIPHTLNLGWPLLTKKSFLLEAEPVVTALALSTHLCCFLWTIFFEENFFYHPNNVLRMNKLYCICITCKFSQTYELHQNILVCTFEFYFICLNSL